MREIIIGLLSLAAVIATGYGLSKGLDHALTRHHENQNTMLCKSAIKSGNETYTKKCQCYYKGEDISCLN